MKRHLLTTPLWLTLGVLLMAAVFAPFSFTPQQALATQSAPPAAMSSLYLLRVTHVKPEMAQEYRAFMQNESIPAYRKGGVKLRNTLTTAIFGEALEYVTIEPIESLKQFDEPDPLYKALGEDGYRAWTAKWVRMIAGSHACVVQLRPDLSVNLPKPGTPHAKFGYNNVITIAPGRTAEYESYVKNDLLPIMQKSYPQGVLVSKVLLGGNGNEYRVLIPVDSFADLERGLLATAQEGFAKAQQKSAGIVLHAENSIFRYVPELSISPSAPK